MTKCIELMDDAERRQKKYDWCVCLVDRDRHSTLSEAAEYAAEHGVLLLVSNLKFEMWLLWHVLDVRGPRSSRELDELMRKHKLLTGKDIAVRFPFDGVDDAVRTAEAADPEARSGRVGPDPSSAMPILVRLMRGEQGRAAAGEPGGGVPRERHPRQGCDGDRPSGTALTATAMSSRVPSGRAVKRPQT